jgi:hypothetical protein
MKEMITVKTLITSTPVSEGQREQVSRVIIDAMSKGVRSEIKGLAESGALNTSNFQRVLAQGNALGARLAAAVKAEFVELVENIVGFLKLISGGETIVIAPTDGHETIAQAGDLFTGWVDGDFQRYGTNVPSEPTKDTPVQVFEMIKNGTFAQIFGGFGENLDRLCLSQAQIISFVQNHAKWLRADGYGTFFLFKVGDEYFVARVCRSSDGLGVGADRLSDGYVWGAEYRHRVVVPQL